MARDTLLDFFEDFSKQRDTFIVHDDGYRVRRATYRQMAESARALAARLGQAGVRSGDRVVIWSENRPEWIAAFWACVLIGAVVVPVDARSSVDLLERIVRLVQAKVIFAGDEVIVPQQNSVLVWPLRDTSLSQAPSPERLTPNSERQAPSAERPSGLSLAEIIFTSGATADPKGVTITHRNILANLIPIEREIRKYRRYERPFHPIRFLNLLPLSHLFGQSMAAFVPPMIGGTVVFSHGYSPTEIVRQISSRRVSVLVCVPKVLDVLREHIVRMSPKTATASESGARWWKRWWRHRDVHRMFGWKFWCVVVGAAPLEPEAEAFWRALGFVVVQGYGLTETAPIVTLNHPFRASRGTVGTPIAGVDVRIAADGEILVRGDNVTSGYYRAPGATDATAATDTTAFEADGWFHTGDIGEVDSAGRLAIKGRKKEMIVTAQGLNVFPEDVERALLAQPRVTDAGVVGVRIDGEERVHAALVVDPGADVDAIVRAANATLDDHQRVWRALVWPGDALPRTDGTQKLKRREIQRWVSGEREAAPAATGATVEAIVGRYVANRTLTPETTIEELGLSSLDRVELMMALEKTFRTTVDESAFAKAKTLADLNRLVTERAAASSSSASTSAVSAPPEAPITFPSWNRSWLARFVRRISLPTWILPLGRIFMRLEVVGQHHLDNVAGPVVFAVNHQSLLDVPALLLALPSGWRYRVAPAMARELFSAHFHRESQGWGAWLRNTLMYLLACEFFNAFPLPQREAGTRETLRYIGEVVAGGDSIVIFPEGRRTSDGTIARFQPGVGMIAARIGLAIVPVRIDGLDRVLGRSMRVPTRGPVRITFGPPINLASAAGQDYQAVATQVEEAVRRL